MKKKLLAILLSLTMVMTLLPTTAFAGEATLTIGGSTYDLYSDQSGDGWKLDADGYYGDPVLILCGYNGSEITCNTDLYIWVAADTVNTVTTSYDGISCGGDLDIDGYGDLAIHAGGDGLIATGHAKFYTGGDLTIEADGNGMHAGTYAYIWGYGGDVEITAKQNGVVADDATNSAYLASYNGDITINADGAGIVWRGAGALTIKPCGGKFTITAGDDGVVVTNTNLEVYPYGSDIEINAAAGDGIRCESGFVWFEPYGGDVTIDAGDYGVWAYGTILLNSCNNDPISITAGNDALYSESSWVDIGYAAQLDAKSTGGNAIGFGSGSSSVMVYLSGYGERISLTAGSGKKAVYCYSNTQSPVNTGYEFADYTAVGAPDAQSVVYTRGLDELCVDGTQVTDPTVADSGMGWSWDPATRTLTLSDYGGGYISAYGSLNIVLEGTENQITSDSNNGIYISCGDLSISGSADLTIDAADANGIYVECGDLDLDIDGDLTIGVTGNKNGVYVHYGDMTGKVTGDLSVTAEEGSGLYIDNTFDLTVGGNLTADVYYYAVSGFYGDLTLDVGGDMTLTATDSSDACDFYTYGGDLTLNVGGNATFTSAYYGIYRYGGTGDVKLRCDNGMTIDAAVYGIYNDDCGMSLDNDGPLTITADESTARGICSDASVAFKGEGTVDITADENAVYICDEGNVIFSGSGAVTLTSESSNTIRLDDEYEVGNSVLLEGANTPITLKAGEHYYAVWRSSDDESPVAGSSFDNYNVEGAPDDDQVVYTCSTSPVYPVWIGDTQVSEDNKADVLSDGSVAYNSDTNTLTLSGASIESIYADETLAELTVNLVGSNEISSSDGPAIYAAKGDGCKLNFVGTGSLAVTGESNHAIYTEGKIEFGGSCSVTANANGGDAYSGQGTAAIVARAGVTVSTSGKLTAKSAYGCAILVDYGCFTVNSGAGDIYLSSGNSEYGALYAYTTSVPADYTMLGSADADAEISSLVAAKFDGDTYCSAIIDDGDDVPDNDVMAKTFYIYKKAAPVSSGGSSSYSVTAESAKNGTFTVDKKNASAGSTVTITVTPDKGFTLETLTVTDKNGKEIDLKDLGNGKYSFKMPASKVTVEATFMEDNTMLNFFVDVKANDYYYDAVLWAAENDITKGTDATHFSPNVPVTRGQVVTFLWRAAGCPVVNYYMNMSDVKSGEYYSEAVRWALAEGITKGTSETTFSPDAVCTRGQIVTFLARFAGVEDEATGYTHGFTDVKATDYFNNAVAWAKDNKVTEGTSATTFSPNTNCTRAQVVTFLYRWMVK